MHINLQQTGYFRYKTHEIFERLYNNKEVYSPQMDHDPQPAATQTKGGQIKDHLTDQSDKTQDLAHTQPQKSQPNTEQNKLETQTFKNIVVPYVKVIQNYSSQSIQNLKAGLNLDVALQRQGSDVFLKMRLISDYLDCYKTFSLKSISLKISPNPFRLNYGQIQIPKTQHLKVYDTRNLKAKLSFDGEFKQMSIFPCYIECIMKIEQQEVKFQLPCILAAFMLPEMLMWNDQFDQFVKNNPDYVNLVQSLQNKLNIDDFIQRLQDNNVNSVTRRDKGEKEYMIFNCELVNGVKLMVYVIYHKTSKVVGLKLIGPTDQYVKSFYHSLYRIIFNQPEGNKYNIFEDQPISSTNDVKGVKHNSTEDLISFDKQQERAPQESKPPEHKNVVIPYWPQIDQNQTSLQGKYSGLILKAAFQRQGQNIFLQMVFTNNSQISFTNFALKINNNCFRLAYSKVQIPDLVVNPGESRQVKLNIQLNGTFKQIDSCPYAVICALKVLQHMYAFKVPCLLTIAMVPGKKMTFDRYRQIQENQQTIKRSMQECQSILNLNDFIKRLEDNNLNLLVQKEKGDLEMLVFGCQLINGCYLIAEIVFEKATNNFRTRVAVPKKQYAICLQHTIQIILKL